MWTQTKQNYDKHVEQTKNWKDIAKEDNWTSKVGLVLLFLMDWQALMLDGIFEHSFDQGCIYLLWA
jgi:hypothetical protein